MMRQRPLLLVSALSSMVAYGVGAESISFPARSSDLALGSVWSVIEASEGCCVLDLNVQRWVNGLWFAGGDDTNAENFDWDVPLYAPANGEVASCWRNFPDNDFPGHEGWKDPPGTFGGGNHVMIITDEGNAISLNHFRQGTIPAGLCPNNADSTTYPSTNSKEGSWRVAAYVPQGSRPRLSEGQYLGRVGSSGRSGRPHLHTSMQKVIGHDSFGREELGDFVPMTFRNVWAKLYAEDVNNGDQGWFRLRGHGFVLNEDCKGYYHIDFADECRFKFLNPSPFLRKGEATAGEAGLVSTLFLNERQVVTGIRDADGDLKLIVWELAEDGTFTRRGDASAGAITDVSLSSPEPAHVLAAVRDTDGDLKMIAYRVTQSGEISRIADRSAGAVGLFDTTVVRDPAPVQGVSGLEDVTVTAVQTGTGALKIIAWDIDSPSGSAASVVRLGEAAAGSISHLAAAGAKHFYGLYTAVRTEDGNLKVIPWQLAQDLSGFVRMADAEAGQIEPPLDVAPLGAGVVAAVKDREERLKLIAWEVDGTGNAGARSSDQLAGHVIAMQMVAAPDDDGSVATISRGENGYVTVIGWVAEEDGTGLRRLGSSRTGEALGLSSDITLRSLPRRHPRGMLVTGLVKADGKLKVVGWDTNFGQP